MMRLPVQSVAGRLNRSVGHPISEVAVYHPMIRATRASLLSLMILVSVIASPSIAAAGQAATKPAAWGFVDLNAQYIDGSSFCLVGGELPSSTPLPAPVELAVPASSTAQWVGEVVSDNPAADKQLPYTISRRGTMDIYRMTLQGSRLAQVEAIVPGMITFKDGKYAVAIAWIAPAPVPRVRISVGVPPNAQIVEGGDNAQTASDPTGTKYYYRQVSGMKTGDKVSLNLTYSIPTAAPVEQTDGGGTSTTLLVIIGLGLVVVVGLIVALVVQRGRGGAQSDEAEADDSDQAEADDSDEAE